jgi:hypothetical protein
MNIAKQEEKALKELLRDLFLVGGGGGGVRVNRSMVFCVGFGRSLSLASSNSFHKSIGYMFKISA